MKLRTLAKEKCGGKDCPTVYQDESTGDLIVQGYVLEQAARDIQGMPENENAVRIPKKLIERLASHFGKQ